MPEPFAGPPRRMTGRTPAVALALLWVGVVLAFWLGLFVPSMQPGLRRPMDADLYGYFAPKYVYGNQELAAGRLPLWNPYEYGGLPFLGAAQPSVLYPPKILAFAVAGGYALHAYMLIHYALAGVFAFIALRGLGLSTGGALLGVVTWVFTTVNMDSNYHPNRLTCLVWIPLVFLFAVRMLERPGARPAAALALAAALTLLAGYPEYALDTTVALAVFALAAAPALGWHRRLGRTAAWLAAATALAAALAALQVLPLLDTAAESVRAAGAPVSAPGQDVFQLAAPALRTDPLGTFRGLTALYAHVFHLAPAAWALAVTGALFGAPPLRVAFTALWLFIVAFASILAGPLHDLPVFSLLRGNYCWIGLSYLPAAWLAGAGVDVVLERPAGTRPGIGRVVAWTAVIAASAAMLGPRGWLGMLVAVALLALARVSAPLRVPAVAALAAAALVALWTENPPGYTDLPHRYARKEPAYPSLRAPATGLAAALAGRCGPEPTRILAPWHLWDGTPIRERVDMVQGYPEPIAPLRVQRLLRRAGLDADVRVLPDWEDVATNGRVLDMLNVGCILVPALARLDVARLGLVEAGRIGPDVFYRRTSPLPRAFLVYRATAVGDGEAALAAVFRPGFEPDSEAVLENVVAPAMERGDGRAVVTAIAPGALDLAVTTSTGGLLVVSQTFFPGWRATLDGAPVPLVRADYLLMAVNVPAGDHRVTLRYRPRSAEAGALLSALGAVVTAAFLRRRR